MIRLSFLLCTFLYSLMSNAQKSPLDKAKVKLLEIERSMAGRFDAYKQRYAQDTLVLKALTTYEYDENNQLRYEKSYGSDQSSLYVYQNKKIVEKLDGMMGRFSLELNTYDKEGVLTEKKSYNDYFPENVQRETYSSQQIDHRTRDTVTILSYINGYPVQRTVSIYDSKKQLRQMLSYKPMQDTLPSYEVSYGYDPQNKQILRYVTRMRKLDYHKETTLRYNEQGLEESSMNKDLISGKTEETLTYYEKKLPVREESLKDGKPELTRTYEYDKKGKLICETARNASGELRYRCRYEYDARGNKITYLYFFRY